ncbi:helix-turn-helix domain-containing protein [Paenibacillus soyae]|uniref:Helix-turn-helix domain-containing protein n=1 Tax=Paenibacillus soyae TaxID=2969249 RepID=A0A9X2MRX8_9BACL|nr:helix-turn-helix domain-containing protein [Paenibacillus soyae]MCR2804708.1 helix-turn-helix domain-containing protein [Paenibacillus soyae]
MRRKRIQSVTITWFLSYVIVLLLPMVISVFVYQEYSRSLKNETRMAYSSLLMQLQEAVDNDLESMKRLSHQIAWDQNIQNLLRYTNQDVSQGGFSYDLFLLAQNLSQYKSTYVDIDQFYIYLSTPYPTVVFPGVVNEPLMAYQFVHMNETYSYEAWIGSMQDKVNQGLISMPRLGDKPAIAFVQSFESARTRGPAGMSVVMIDQARILSVIHKVQLFNEGKVFIVNPNNELLVSSDEASEELLEVLKLEQLSSPSGYVSFESEGQRFEVIYLQSPATQTKFISIVPSQVLWEKAEKVRSLTYLSLLASILVGVILSLLLLRKNYGPIRRLLHKVTEKAGGSALQREGNEFAYIEHSLNQTYLKMDEMLVDMKQNHHVLRSYFISRLLKGKLDSRLQMEDTAAAHDISFISEEFAVMLLLVEDADDFYQRVEWLKPTEQQQMLQFIISNVVEELAKQKHKGFVVEIDDVFACLINLHSSEVEHNMNDLMQLAQEAQSFLHQSYQINLTISISTIHSSLTGIHQAYLHALDAMEYKLVMGRREIIRYDKIRYEPRANQNRTYYYPLVIEQKLINAVKTGNKELAVQSLVDIIEQNFTHHIQSLPIVKCLMFDLASTLLKTMNETDFVEELEGNTASIIEQLMHSQTVQDMQEQLIIWVSKVCEYTFEKRESQITESRQRAVQDLVHDVMSYIEANVSDANLNVAMIGELVQMSPTYVSKLFKQHTGDGLLEYLNKYRVQQAKKLIEDQQMGIKEVAEKVGYTEANTFIRIFKKYEGITPGKYRDFLMR